MRTPIRWLLGLAGLVGLVRLVRMRRSVGAGRATPALDPAVELRRKLDATRSAGEASPASGSGERPEPGLDPRALEDRRSRVHRRAHEAIDSMRGADA